MSSPHFLVRCLFASLLGFPWTTQHTLHECPLEAKYGTIPSFHLVVDGKKCRCKCISTSTEVAPSSWLWDKLHSSASRSEGLLYKAGEVSGPMALLSWFFVCVPYVPHTQAFVQRSSRRWATFQLIIHHGRKSKAEVPPFKNKVELVSPESLLGTQLSPDPDLLNHNLPSYQSSGRFVGTGCWGLLLLDGGSCPQKQTKPQPFIGDELEACLYKILACQEELDTELRGSLGEQ